MRAATGKTIHRTVGDTVPLLVRLATITDAGEQPVSDAALVEMVVGPAGAPLTIAAVARGDGSGVFLIPVAELDDAPGRVPFAIRVSEAAGAAVFARGTILTAPLV